MTTVGKTIPGVATSGSERAFTAVVLAGGRGTRLASVVADRPKPLAPVDGEPFLLRLLDQLAAAGCARVVLCTGHLGDQIEAELGREHAGMALCYSREARPLGTGGALRLALPLLQADSVLVLNGDSYVDVDLAGFVARARHRGGAALLAVAVADTMRYGRLEFAAAPDAGAAGDASLVVGLREKGVPGPGAINAGIYWLPRLVLAGLPADEPLSFETDVLPQLVATGLPAERHEAPFLDIGVPADYAAAADFFAACAARRQRPRKGLLVVDRDGTLIVEKHYLADPAGVELLPGVVDGLRSFAAEGYEVAVVTNQSGVGRGYFDEQRLAEVHAELQRQLAAHGIAVRGIWYCPHHPELRCGCRKPEPGLLHAAMDQLGYRKDQVLVVGDKACDIELGARLGVRTALVRTGYGAGTEQTAVCRPDHVVDSLAELAREELRP